MTETEKKSWSSSAQIAEVNVKAAKFPQFSQDKQTPTGFGMKRRAAVSKPSHVQ